VNRAALLGSTSTVYLQAGVDFALTGSTVFLEPGVYTGIGNVGILGEKDLTISGTTGNATAVLWVKAEGDGHDEVRGLAISALR
jgi:hypothetical protein